MTRRLEVLVLAALAHRHFVTDAAPPSRAFGRTTPVETFLHTYGLLESGAAELLNAIHRPVSWLHEPSPLGSSGAG